MWNSFQILSCPSHCFLVLALLLMRCNLFASRHFPNYRILLKCPLLSSNIDRPVKAVQVALRSTLDDVAVSWRHKIAKKSHFLSLLQALIVMQGHQDMTTPHVPMTCLAWICAMLGAASWVTETSLEFTASLKRRYGMQPSVQRYALAVNAHEPPTIEAYCWEPSSADFFGVGAPTYKQGSTCHLVSCYACTKQSKDCLVLNYIMKWLESLMGQLLPTSVHEVDQI